MEQIKELLKKIKADIMMSAVVSILVGAAVMIWPGQTTVLLCRAIALILLIMGIAELIAYASNRKVRRFGLPSGIVLTAIGIYIMMKPGIILQILSMLIGIVLVLHGIKDIQLVMEGKTSSSKRWWLPSLFSTITIMFGLMLIWDYFQAATLVAWMLGLALVYDGISDILILMRLSSAQKEAREEEEAIDVEWKE